MEKKLISTDKGNETRSPVLFAACKRGRCQEVDLRIGSDLGSKIRRTDPAAAGAQAESILKNMKAIVEESGANMGDIVKLNFYLKRMNDLDEIAKMHFKYFNDSRSSSTPDELIVAS